MRLFLIAAVCLTFAAYASAADSEAGPPAEKGKDKGTAEFLDGLTESLDLNAAQTEKVKALTKDYFERTKAKTEEAKALREKLTALEKDLSEQTRRLEETVRGELTFEQKDRFDMLRIHRRQPPREMREMREKRIERMMERRGGGQGGRRGGPPGMEDEGGPSRFPPEMWQEGRGRGGRGGQDGKGGPGKRDEGDSDEE